MKNLNTCRLPTEPTRNWVDLPAELTANILHRLGAIEILMSAQMVCTSWYTICKDPSMWRIIDMSYDPDSNDPDSYDPHSFIYLYNLPRMLIPHHDLRRICKSAIDRSQGQLVDINFDESNLLDHIIERGCQLKRLEAWAHHACFSSALGKAIKELPFLEEISLNLVYIFERDLEIVGRFCPMLKSFKLNMNRNWRERFDDKKFPNDNEALIISKYMPQLQHLQLIGNPITDIGLKAILDACVHLQSLDLRLCSNLEFKGNLLKRCSEQINDLKLPNDSIDSHFGKQRLKGLSSLF